MSLSLNEVEALTKKAARGAGYTWGLAEEAAKATRWLCARDLDGCEALADLLVGQDGLETLAGAPVTGPSWASREGRLCPIATGCALSDDAERLDGGGLRLETVARPILLAPFAGSCARHLETGIALNWGNVCVSTDGDALFVEGDPETECATVTVSVGVQLGSGKPQAVCSRARPNSDAQATLERFAHRTYAPATEASRLTGAGAGVSDND